MHVLINKYMTHIQIKEVETGMENVTTVFHDGKTEEKIRLLYTIWFLWSEVRPQISYITNLTTK